MVKAQNNTLQISNIFTHPASEPLFAALGQVEWYCPASSNTYHK